MGLVNWSEIPVVDVERAMAFSVYFRVDDVVGTLARALERGGSALYAVTDVGEQGVVAEFADTEGNRIALSGPR